MAGHIDFGAKGEQAAKEYLQGKGYKILKTNFRIGHAEVDIIAEDKKQIVFIEVKTRMREKFGNPEIAVNREKRRNMKRVARAYIEIFKVKGQVRFDIISLVSTEGAQFDITHFEDAFFLM